MVKILLQENAVLQCIYVKNMKEKREKGFTNRSFEVQIMWW